MGIRKEKEVMQPVEVVCEILQGLEGLQHI